MSSIDPSRRPPADSDFDSGQGRLRPTSASSLRLDISIRCERRRLADPVAQSELRYLVNSLRDVFELPGTAVRIALREKANPQTQAAIVSGSSVLVVTESGLAARRYTGNSR